MTARDEDLPKPIPERLKPPVLKQALNQSQSWSTLSNALGMHMADIERLLLMHSDAPAELDRIPLESSIDRSKALVAVLTKAKASKPEMVRTMLALIAPAMQRDRIQRGTSDDDATVFVEAISEISRDVVVAKSSYPRY